MGTIAADSAVVSSTLFCLKEIYPLGDDNEKSQRSNAWKFFKIAGIIWLVLLAVFIIIATNYKSDPEGWGMLGLAMLGFYTLVPSLCVIVVIALVLKILPRLSGSSGENKDTKDDSK